MDYMICNNRRVYIRLAENGRPETCGERDCGRVEYSKARNIVDNLPKILKKMNFKVEAIPDIKLKKTEIDNNSDMIYSAYYDTSQTNENKVLDKIKQKLNKVFEEMVEKNILEEENENAENC